MGKGCGDVEAIERLWSGRMGRIEGGRARRDGEEKAGRDQGLITLGRDRDRRGSSRRHCDELSGGRETVGIAVEGASFLTARTVCFLSRLRSRQRDGTLGEDEGFADVFGYMGWLWDGDGELWRRNGITRE